MKVEANGVLYFVESFHDKKSETIVLLHGFTGSTKSWHAVVPFFQDYRVVLIDLIGHGKTASPEEPQRYTMEQQVADLDVLFSRLSLEKIILAGYSMGGRTALAYACSYPDRIKQLILESASPGLRTETERTARRLQDERLAERLLDDGIAAFTKFWEEIPLFDSQKGLPEHVRQTVREERLGQNAAGLAGSLRGMGTGVQQSYWDHLDRLSFPVLLITGKEDTKFTALGQTMCRLFKQAIHMELDAGHAIHVEKPKEFATMVVQQLNKNLKEEQHDS